MIGRLVKVARWTALVLAAAAGAAMLAGAVARVPDGLRRLETFHVQQVEVLGARYLAPHEALAASGVGRASSLFEPQESWLSGLRAHPMIADARVERRWPSALVLHVTEVEPAALVALPEVRVADAAGRILPLDPAGQTLDLPVVVAPRAVNGDADDAADAARELVSAYARVRRLEPELADRVSEVRAAGGSALALLLAEPRNLRVLLPLDVGAAHMRQLDAVMADLEARGELDRVRRIDLRFREQVVISVSSTVVS